MGIFYSAILLPAALGLLMFGMGLSLTIEDFRRVLIQPRSLFIGLFAQMILLPAIAFTIAHLANLPAELKVGFVIIAACPGGATSNLITYLLRGNVALSISLTTVNSFLTLVTTPLLIFLGLLWFMGTGETVQLPIGPTILKIFAITLLPTSLGIIARYKWTQWAIKSEKPLRFILPVLYGIIYIVAILGGKADSPDGLSGIYLKILPWAIALNLLGMTLGFGLALIARQKISNQVTLAVEVGIQNSALAITIASSSIFLDNYFMAIPAIIYGFFTFASAIIFGYLVKKYSR